MRRSNGHARMYVSKAHVAATLFFVFAPFAFVLIFSKLAHIAAPILLVDIAISIIRLFFGYIIAALLGWGLAIAFYRGKRAIVALPIFDVLQSFPTFAALPLAIWLWGPSNTTVIIFLVLTIIWPIFFSVVSAMKLIKHEWEEAAQIMNLRGWNFFKLFLLPISIPSLVTGSIIGLGEGWEAIVATEIIVGMKSGLGNFFSSYSANTGVTTFGILGLLLLIFSVNKILWLPLLEKTHEKLAE